MATITFKMECLRDTKNCCRLVLYDHPKDSDLPFVIFTGYHWPDVWRQVFHYLITERQDLFHEQPEFNLHFDLIGMDQ